MLDSTLSNQLQTYLEKLRHPIELVATVNDSTKSQELRELLQHIAGLHDLITYREDGTNQRTPSFTIARTGTDIEVRFAGIPLGHEFTSLVLALLHVGGHLPNVPQDLLDDVRSITGTHHFETYYSLSCQNCPDVVQALNIMAVFNGNVTHTAIDGAIYPEEIKDRDVLAVPAVYRNGEPFAQGRMSLEDIVTKLDTGSAEKAAERLSGKDPFEVLVVGGGPAGAAAAIYAARKGLRTGVLAQRFGGQMQDTVGIENFIGMPYTEGPQLSALMQEHVTKYDVDIMTGQEAAKLVSATESGLHEVHCASGAVLQARTVVVASGARWRALNVPGEAECRNKGVTFCPHCDGPLFKGKPVAVVGGGNSGVEAAIDLAGLASHVTLLEFMPELKADTVLQKALHDLPNVTVRTMTQVTEVVGDGVKVTGLNVTDRETETTETIDVEGVFVQIGLLPNTDWLGDAVELSQHREVVVDDRCTTSVPGVFAAGDCTTVPYKQIVISAGQGATAALSAFDHLIRNPAPTT